MTGRLSDAVVIGAGPYGLAAAAHLRAAGVDARVFGRAMDFWDEHMPKGMFLRSGRDASHIADPHSALTLDDFEQAHGRVVPRPTPLGDFIEYGRWFQRRAVPDLDARRIEHVTVTSDGFRVTCEDGEPIETRRVVVAAGISPFTRRPRALDGLPADLCSHSSDLAEPARFARSRVMVLGGGQSAIECAVLLLEAGADVEVVQRARAQRWLGRSHRLGRFRALVFPRSDVGPAFLGHIAGRPPLFTRLPLSWQRGLAQRSFAPAASGWLRPRAHGLTITTARAIVGASPSGGRLRVSLSDGSDREVDHLLLATGYRIDVARYEFLAPLLSSLRIVDGYPTLDSGFGSSIPGLHFLGAPGVRTFGPIVRFVSGTEFATRALVRGIVRRPAPATVRSSTDRAFEVR
jgi:lysine/ornithine N-monooxygenase